MPETDESIPESSVTEMRGIVLRIPGEHFFCETIDVPRNLDPEAVSAFAEQALFEEGLSPFPLEQEAWGYYASLEHGRILLFATSYAKLRQDGWQNLEVFRRVFPSFISFLGKEYDRPTICLLRYEETLTGLSYEEECPVPAQVFSLPLTEEELQENRCDETRGKLLSLFDLDRYEIEPEILLAGDVERSNDGVFNFEHHTADSDTDLDETPHETASFDANELWSCDVRSSDFKQSEQARREWVRRRWTAFLAWGVGVAALVVAFVGSKVFEKKSEQRDLEAQAMAADVPLVEESQKLLEKLRQNKLGGIDPFGALARLASQRGGQGDQPHVWFKKAHFASRIEIILEGEGRDVEAVNNFIKGMEDNDVGNLQVDKRGDKKRKINSSGGKTSFTIELKLLEAKNAEEASAALAETPEASPEGG